MAGKLRNRLCVLACLAVLGATVFVGIGLFRIHQHRQAYRDVEREITRLALRKPESVNNSQWATCLLHTWNLHTNYGPFLTSDELQKAADQLRAGRAELETIDEFWMLYVRLTNGRAARYDDANRPTQPKFLDELKDRSATDNDDLNEWLQMERAARSSP